MESFHKVYSCYYQVMKHILMEARMQPLTRKQVEAIVQKYGFQESALAIMPKLIQGEWALLQENEDGTYSPLVSQVPELPYTVLQKSWMKSLLSDPRILLFLSAEEKVELEQMLAGTEALYAPEDFHYFDRYLDRDNYEDVSYQEHFRTVLRALEEKKALLIAYGGKKRLKTWAEDEKRDGPPPCEEPGPGDGPFSFQWEEGDSTLIEALPYQLQYSSKDDKFRLCCLQYSHGRFCRETVLNLARVKACHISRREVTEQPGSCRFSGGMKAEEPVIIEISGERNSLERCMLHFASYEKHTEYDEEKNAYICSIYYDKADETELLIEILSFGPVIRVLGPELFLCRIRERVGKQHKLLYREI